MIMMSSDKVGVQPFESSIQQIRLTAGQQPQNLPLCCGQITAVEYQHVVTTESQAPQFWRDSAVSRRRNRGDYGAFGRVESRTYRCSLEEPNPGREKDVISSRSPSTDWPRHEGAKIAPPPPRRTLPPCVSGLCFQSAERPHVVTDRCSPR